MMRVPFAWRCLSKSTIERYRFRQTACLASELSGSPSLRENLRMDAGDQHLLVIRSIEDADPPALGQIARGTPQKIVLQLLRARMFEAEYLTALRIDAGHYVPDGAIFSGGIHRLKDQ